MATTALRLVRSRLRSARSVLISPANVPRMLEKCTSTAADVLMPDLEDSVPTAHKSVAREVLRRQLPSVARNLRPGVLLIPRVNSAACEDVDAPQQQLRRDLEAVLAADAVAGGGVVAAISVGKVHSAANLRDFVRVLSEVECALCPPERRGRIAVLPWIESAAGVVHAAAICSGDAAEARLAAVAFGADDFAHDVGVHRDAAESRPSGLFQHARCAVALAAKAAGVAALDSPWTQLRDVDGLAAESAAVRALGFSGKTVIHPAAVDVVNAAFGAPERSAVQRSARLVAAFEAAMKAGRASIDFEGEMVDVPVYRRARTLLEKGGHVGEKVP